MSLEKQVIMDVDGSIETVGPQERIMGVNRRVLHVDLTKGMAGELHPSQEDYRRFLGGQALGKHLLLRPNIRLDPLNPNSSLGFFPGPLTGYFPGSGTCVAVGLSPLTDRLGSSISQGLIGTAIKAAGYDGIIITGKSDHLSTMVITRKGIFLDDASDLADTPNSVTEEILKTKHSGLKPAIISIGPAGENQVRFASVQSGGRTFGRQGFGAVMGSKNLKAIVIEKGKLPEVADQKAVNRISREIREMTRGVNRYTPFTVHGTASVLDSHARIGTLDSEYFSHQYSLTEGLSTADLSQQTEQDHLACPGCVVCCARKSNIKLGEQEVTTHGPEYESTFAIGINLRVYNPEDIAKLEYLCDEYGLDVLSTGAAIGFLFRAVKEGLVKFDGGVSVEIIKKLIADIVARNGLGDQLAEGASRFAIQVGPEAEQLVMAVKGLDMAAIDPRGKGGIPLYGTALAFATGPEGAHHRRSIDSRETENMVPGNVLEGKAAAVARKEQQMAAMNALGTCSWSFGGFDFETYLAAIQAVTGLTLTVEEYRQVGHREVMLTRLFNALGGEKSSGENRLPERLYTERRFPGDAVFSKEIMADLIQEFNTEMGLDSAGNPTRQSLIQLDLVEYSDLIHV
ncbi:hypothetical protein A2781_07445 [Candidatus Gottesmanbacteria bacterium RIFCSPHIGHO2_01_FULL_42_27]|uniref:Aldehyde ferredoxin oxidoreductase N-terminal domain-containing protein n=2 Tax=Candidatus Gottesmaniibacteriota TaxID=1752720 RepID=A0A1F6BID0_9BACT|nr:MAG: hypothetical protein A2781_07445 [Candidatus Gottesmanbacteria bacterium RIFCSPHIGHO2_01_FULL_42_27]OGG20070.1 MAG: hypothetical protein A3E72_05495 [Candidatus Gottesmanbacteria bacterium RIFCSPHIGHO2_12_FULL_43_26]OGG34634.1 MAG: hypothetical protein A3G68_00855 [Candidatus Gottesmanbacteria bacterium RIFCSPLOWO2_12_FULL_42_10]OGG36699.1 MAG: hypothetical protein A2968_01735 [Candidatus Gottesmanbacteria bacterium RIFCSPLOWO2_01_FULL_42_22]